MPSLKPRLVKPKFGRCPAHRGLSWSRAAFAALCLLAGAAQGQPLFSKVFDPSTIGPGSVSILSFRIENTAGSPVSNLAFTDTLPAGVTIADPAGAGSSCSTGSLSAPAGGGTISFSGGSLGAGSSCTVEVLVTSATVGTLMNVSGDLTSSAGNSGPATADLTVDSARPGFSKAFSPASINLGSRSTLTFTIDNTLNGAAIFNPTFTDSLPAGLVVADPSNASTSCNGAAITATPGSSSISLVFTGFSTVPAGSSCTVSVDVVGTSAGTLENVSDELLSTIGGPSVSSGLAAAGIEVTADELQLSKSFTDDPVLPGDTVNLEFTLRNRSRSADAVNLAFTDDLNATLSGLSAVGLPLNDVCGAGSQLSGTSVIALTAGNLPAGGNCSFAVTLQVPAGATPGVYPNSTSSLSGDLGGAPVTSAAAGDSLTVTSAPQLTKTFLDNPVGPGATVSMEFTLTNSSATAPATDIGFQDNLSAFLSGASVVSLPAAGFCGSGSFIGTTMVVGELVLVVSGANLPAAASCTFTVDLQLPVGAAPGDYGNSTGDVTATVGGVQERGDPASDVLTVVSSPSLSKQFIDDPVAPGNTVTLAFELRNDAEGAMAASAIAFSDDLDATLSGLTATGLPMNDVCGAGSQLSGTSSLSFSGGSLAGGATCSFSVTLQVPAAALPGAYTNSTSNLTATVAGEAVSDGPAQDVLDVSGLSFAKEFIDDPALPGGTTTLRFTIENTSTSSSVSDMSFSDSLSGALTGLASTSGTRNDICGAGSQISGTSALIFTGGNLAAGTQCSFDLVLQVPAAAADGSYGNVTSTLAATIDGNPVSLDPATDTLTVGSELILLSKSFPDGPAQAGGTVTLQFDLTNASATETLTGISFTDDLDAALSGLTSTSGTVNDVCGVGSQISGTGLLTFTGGNLGPGASCQFSVTLQVPAGAAAGTSTNVTSTATAMAGGVAVSGNAASADLAITAVEFLKAFDGPGTAGGTAVLSFTISNLDDVNPLSGLAFTDDLNAVLSGLVATGLPLADVCGTGSQLSGTSLLTFTGGDLPASGSCSFDVALQLPAGATAGSYPNTTSALTSSGLSVAEPATANLVIEPPPVFGKSFVPSSVNPGESSTLTLTIDNSASAVAAGSLDVTDNLPTGMTIADPPNASSICSGGTVTAVAGSGTLSYTGGTVSGGASCSVQADVVVASAGSLVNTTGDLTSSSGNSGTASATLTVLAVPQFSASVAPTTVEPGGTATLSFLIDHTAGAVDATGLGFSLALPSGVIVADPSNATSTCTGATISAPVGGSSFSFSNAVVAAGTSCTISVDLTVTTAGSYTLTTDDLTSSSGNSGPAGVTLGTAPTVVSSLGVPGLLLLIALLLWVARSGLAGSTGRQS